MNEYNAAERRDVKAAIKQARQTERNREEIIRGIMSLGPGRAWMLDLLESCHIFASSYSSDNGSMAFSEGERNIGLRLLNDIMRACPDQYIVMMRERNARDSTAVARRNQPDTDGGDSGDTDGADTDDDGGTKE